MLDTPVSLSRSTLATLLLAALSTGCAARIPIEHAATSELDVVLEANAKTVWPGLPLKFYLNVTNLTDASVTFDSIDVEIVAVERENPEIASLRQSWTFRWSNAIALAPGRKLTLPVVPEIQRRLIERRLVEVSEFPLGELSPGEYVLKARFNERFISSPLSISVRRPELERTRAR